MNKHNRIFTLSVISITAFLFLLSAHSLLYNTEVPQVQDVIRIKSTITRIELLSTQENFDNDHNHNHNHNLTEDERIKSFFHSRILEFFNDKCDIQFFMTWISPASSFGSREFLALETLFKNNHGCLMILSESLDSIHGDRIFKPLLDQGFRVKAVKPEMEFLVKDTPAESWFDELKSGNKDPGEIPLPQNLSNLIRLAVLYKYGGVYLDTDFIVLKSFKGLRNSIGAQSMDSESKNWTRLNNAVLVFDKNHPLLFKFIEEFSETFDGNKWGHNGPYLVSRVVEKVNGRPGFDFGILPPMAFYPVSWNKISGFFKKPENRAESRWVNAKILQLSGDTYGVHLWNKQSSKIRIENGSVMARLISDNCLICKYIDSSLESRSS